MKNTYGYFGIVIALIILFITGCNNIPDGISNEMYNLGCDAANIGQDYIDEKISQASAYQKLQDIYEQSAEILDQREYDVKRNGAEDKYHLDVLVSADIAYLQYYVINGDTLKVIDELDSLNESLKPTSQSQKKGLKDILKGEWIFQHANGWKLDITFDYVEFDANMYDDKGEFRSNFSSEYELDEDKGIIYWVYNEKSKKKWARIKNYTNSSFDYEIIGASGNTTAKGSATKKK